MKKRVLELLNKAIGHDGIEIEVPKEKNHGDYSLNLAFLLSKKLKKPPIEIARHFKEKIEAQDRGEFFKKIEIAGPGFINLFIRDEIIQTLMGDIIAQKENFGKNNEGSGSKVIIEFVSANPTGPLHIGHGRWAAIGDAISNVLKECGYSVHKEFYLNDQGNQIDKLVETIMSLHERNVVPEGGYAGEYIKDAAKDIHSNNPLEIKKTALDKIINDQKETLSLLRINFDRWFSESSLHASGEIKKTIDLLIKKDVTYQKDGALWFKSTQFGDDKDRVLLRESGEPTYFAADVAYHADKFNRGFDLLINVWGTDHHGYVKRIEAALDALGFPSHKLEIIIGQLVILFRNGELVKMSKRTGDMITLREVIDEIGSDATRFFLLMTSPDTHMDFDLELAKQKSLDNPVYYVQYAYARLCSILKNSKDLSLNSGSANLSLLTRESERQLMKRLVDYRDEIAECAKSLQPHHLIRYAREISAIFHSYYHESRVISDDAELSQARLALVEASRIILYNVLKLLGISAPERM